MGGRKNDARCWSSAAKRADVLLRFGLPKAYRGKRSASRHSVKRKLTMLLVEIVDVVEKVLPRVVSCLA
jgi:hypothetical protein